MKILVVGGSGFVGTRLVTELLDAGHDVSILDKVPSPTYPDLVRLGDVRNQDDLTQSLAGVEMVYMLAAEHRDDVSPVSLYYDVNVGGAKNLVSAACSQGVKNIVFTSSVAVYPLNAATTKETSATAPFNDYGRSKLQAEQEFLTWQENTPGSMLMIVRPCVIFGEGNIGNVHNLITQINSNRFLMVGDGSNKKSVAYVGNIVRFLQGATDKNPDVQIINYADKPDLTTAELVSCICEGLERSSAGGLKIPYVMGLVAGYAFDVLAKLIRRPLPLSSIRIKKFCADTTVDTDLLESTGYIAPYSIKEGLIKMIRAMG